MRSRLLALAITIHRETSPLRLRLHAIQMSTSLFKTRKTKWPPSSLFWVPSLHSKEQTRSYRRISAAQRLSSAWVLETCHRNRSRRSLRERRSCQRCKSTLRLLCQRSPSKKRIFQTRPRLTWIESSFLRLESGSLCANFHSLKLIKI